jgi:hypothetical protein
MKTNKFGTIAYISLLENIFLELLEIILTNQSRHIRNSHGLIPQSHFITF